MGSTYVLIHGAGDVGWYWHLVERELGGRGHDVVVMNLPVEDDSASLSDYADVVVDAIGDRENLVVVAQSFGGYVAPIVCDRVPAKLMVLVAAMIPAPRESAGEMWSNTAFKQAARPQLDDNSDLAIFYHDVPVELAREALSRGRRQSETTSREPLSLTSWPDVPTRFVLPQRPDLSTGVAAPGRKREAGHRAGRARLRPHAGPQPAGRTGRAAGDHAGASRRE